MGEKIEDMITRFDAIHERDRQQDRQTGGQTDTAQRHRSRLWRTPRSKTTLQVRSTLTDITVCAITANE